MSLTTKLLAALLILLALLLGVQTARVHSKDAALRLADVSAQEAVAQIARARVETVTVRLAAQRDTVTRVLSKVRVDTFVVQPETAADTAHAVAQLPTAVAQLDTVTRSCRAYVVSCDEFRSAAQQRFAADSSLILGYRATLADRPLPRRWSVGVTGGYGATLSHGTMTTGPSATAGLTWRVF